MSNLKRYNALTGREISQGNLYYREGWANVADIQRRRAPVAWGAASASQQASLYVIRVKTDFVLDVRKES